MPKRAPSPMLFDKLCQNYSPARPPRWREVLLRDVERALTDGARSACLPDVHRYHYAENSVLNFGMPPFAHIEQGTIEPELWAQHLLKILKCFEPRLDPSSIRITPVVDAQERQVLTLMYDIYGTCMPETENVQLRFRVLLDYSCGAVRCITH